MERIGMKKIHVTIPANLYTELQSRGYLFQIDEIVTEFLYDFVEGSGSEKDAERRRD
jgi:hypothetical protein